MSANTDVLLILLRESHISAAYARANPTHILPVDDPLLTAARAAGINTTMTPTIDELRRVIKYALENAVRP